LMSSCPPQIPLRFLFLAFPGLLASCLIFLPAELHGPELDSSISWIPLRKPVGIRMQGNWFSQWQRLFREMGRFMSMSRRPTAFSFPGMVCTSQAESQLRRNWFLGICPALTSERIGSSR